VTTGGGGGGGGNGLYAVGFIYIYFSCIMIIITIIM